MALSNLEGCTMGGLDEGRGHNARILAFTARLNAVDISATSVHSVSKEGTVTNSTSTTLVSTYGNGVTLEVPALVADGPSIFTLTFGQVSSSAATAKTDQIKIVAAQASITWNDGTDETADPGEALTVGVSKLNGDQIKFILNDNDGSASIVDGDDLFITVMALAIPQTA